MGCTGDVGRGDGREDPPRLFCSREVDQGDRPRPEGQWPECRPRGDCPRRFSAAVTYLDPTLGIELSMVGGFTINGENPDTDHRTGRELHVEAGPTKLIKELSAGVIGAHYQQVTGDSGPGATLGPYKGRNTAVGGVIGYDFVLGHTPISPSSRC